MLLNYSMLKRCTIPRNDGVQQLIGQFWKRWRREFLPTLNVRRKWSHPRHNLKEGDVVLIAERKASRGEWPLGCVMEAYPWDDA